MDYGTIIKRAWKITWRHKALWVLGLFAGATGGWGYGSGYRLGSQDIQATRFMDSYGVYSYFNEWLPVIIGATVFLFLLAILWWVIGLAAQGGLVHQVNEAAEDRTVKLGAGWSAGFHFWGRVAIAGLLLLLPMVAIALIGTVASFATLALPFLGGSAPGAGSWAAFSAMMALLIPVSIVAGFLLSNLYALTVRFVVVEDRRPADGISAAWAVIRSRFKDVFLMWLVTVGLAMAFGLAIGLPAFFFAIGIVLMLTFGAWPVAVLVGLVLVAVLVVLGSGFNTFNSALWTIFFRRITGREALQPAAAWAGAPAGYSPAGYPPPAPQPPAPPAPWAPARTPAAPVSPPVVGPPVAGYATAPSIPEAPAPEPPAPEPPAAQPQAPEPPSTAAPPPAEPAVPPDPPVEP